MIRILDRYVVRELLPLVVVGTALFGGIIILFSPLKEALELAQVTGVSQGTMWRVLGLKSLGVVSFCLPMGVLFGAALLSGRWASTGELLAAHSAGVAVGSLMRWVFVTGALVGLVGVAFHEYVAVPGLASARRVEDGAQFGKRARGRHNVHFLEADENTGAPRYLIFAREMDLDSQTLTGVTALVFPPAPAAAEPSRPTILQAAQTVYLGDGKWEARRIYAWGPTDTRPVPLATQVLEVGRAPRDLVHDKREIQATAARQLQQRIARLAPQARVEPDVARLVAQLRMELYGRWSVPLACLPFALLGAPLGARRQGGGTSLALGLSVLVCFLYYTVLRYAEMAGREGYLPPAFAAALTPALALVLGAALLYRAQR